MPLTLNVAIFMPARLSRQVAGVISLARRLRCQPRNTSFWIDSISCSSDLSVVPQHPGEAADCMSAAATQPEVRLAVEADTPEIAHLVERYWRFKQIEGFDADEIQKLLGRLVSQPQFGAVRLATMGRDPVG